MGALAGAPTADVLAAWSGLGYNRRALALQRAAAHVAAHGWPEDLTELPGVGRYTADAVARFALGGAVVGVSTDCCAEAAAGDCCSCCCCCGW